MGGGLMQLVAYGAQDIYLTGNPQITFFKVVYRRHTNFSMESVVQTFNGTANFGSRVTCTISRNGELVNRMYLQVELPELSSGSNYESWVGHKLIKSVEIEIGGQRIDKHYGDWLHIWNELSQTVGHYDGYKAMVEGVNPQMSSSNDLSISNYAARTLYIPLQFWFCRNPGLALPLIALQYHEVKINIEFASIEDVCNDSGKSITKADLYVDYIYLDTDERRRFAQVSHEYLIEQLQFTGDEAMSGSLKLNFNHPVKEIIWVEKEDNAKVGEYTSTYDKAQIQLNSHDRFSARGPAYFQLVQPYQHHERVPITLSPDSLEPNDCANINVYSFALKPEEHQPSGTCNMSRIDNAALKFEKSVVSTATTVKVFAVNYNVLRIMSGMGGLAYSN
jgi:hypothetical protein